MTTLFLHIGPHKTGSTFIQKFFFENRQHLSNLGIGYPDVDVPGEKGLWGHHKLVEKIKRLAREELKEVLFQYLIDDRVIFISSENFDRLKFDEVVKFGDLLSELNVKIIYYYRNYVDLLPSWWQEEVKHGSVVSFQEFIMPHILRPFLSNIINPDVVLDSYVKVFGKENIIIIDYDQALKRQGVLAPIFDLLNMESGLEANGFQNKSLKFEIVEIIRVLNAIAKSNKKLKLHSMSELFLRRKNEDAMRNGVETLTTVIGSHMKPIKLSGGYFDKAIKSALSQKYQSCFYHGLLGDTPDHECIVPGDNWMFQGDALVACERIYQSIMSCDESY